MLRANALMQCIATIKANEHRSSIASTPPVILNFSAGADAAAEMAKAVAFKALLTGIVVPNTFAGISVRNSAAVFGSPTWYKADNVNDWPEADNNRMASILLAPADRNRVHKFSIPYVADGVSEEDITTAILDFLAANATYPTPLQAVTDRLTDVVQVQITRR